MRLSLARSRHLMVLGRTEEESARQHFEMGTAFFPAGEEFSRGESNYSVVNLPASRLPPARGW